MKRRSVPLPEGKPLLYFQNGRWHVFGNGCCTELFNAARRWMRHCNLTGIAPDGTV